MNLNTLIKKLEEIRDVEYGGRGDVEVLILKDYPNHRFHYFKFTSDFKTVFEVRGIGDISSIDRLDKEISIVIG